MSFERLGQQVYGVLAMAVKLNPDINHGILLALMLKR